MNISKFFATMATAVILTGCGGGSSISINSVKGTVGLDELFATEAPECFTFISEDWKVGTNVSGNSVESVFEIWSSSDASCTGTLTNNLSSTVDWSSDGSVDATWNGTPPTLAGGGTMDTVVSASKVSWTLTDFPADPGLVGDVAKKLLFIDDTGSFYIMYDDDPTSPVVDGYPSVMAP